MLKMRKLIICLAIQGLFILAIAIPCAHAISVSIKPIELNLQPGEKYTGSIRVYNEDAETAHVKIYLGDWRQVEENEQYLNVGEGQHSISQWMQLSPKHLSIKPNHWEKTQYEIQVPDDETLSGSYWGIIFVEEMKSEEPKVVPNENGIPTLGVNVVFRYGIKIYTTFPEADECEAAFVDAQTIPVEGGGLDLAAIFENQGNTYLRPFVWLEVRDESGKTIIKEDHQRQTVLPGIKRRYKFSLHDMNIPAGKYTALIIADYSAPLLIAAQAEIEVERD